MYICRYVLFRTLTQLSELPSCSLGGEGLHLQLVTRLSAHREPASIDSIDHFWYQMMDCLRNDYSRPQKVDQITWRHPHFTRMDTYLQTRREMEGLNKLPMNWYSLLAAHLTLHLLFNCFVSTDLNDPLVTYPKMIPLTFDFSEKLHWKPEGNASNPLVKMAADNNFTFTYLGAMIPSCSFIF